MKVTNKKYELISDDTIWVDDLMLYRVKALRDFGSVAAGTIGGYIEKEANLAQEGNCWVADNAMVYENARVSNNAVVSGKAKVRGNAKVHGTAQVCDSALVEDCAAVFGNARVCECSWIEGDTWISEDAEIRGWARVGGNADIYGSTIVTDDAEVHGDIAIGGFGNVITGSLLIGNYNGNARITNSADYLVVKGLGSANRVTTFYRTWDGIKVTCGCYTGMLNEFVEQVKETHKDTKYAKEYLAMVEVAKIYFEL